MEKDNKDTIKKEKELAFYYLKNFSDTVREPFLILDFELRVIVASPSFFEAFQVSKEQTENQLIYNLGNGQWNIPELRTLLEKILPDKKVIKNFEVEHEFPKIGLKFMSLNAMRLDTTEQILLAIEDITLKKTMEKRLADYAKELEKGVYHKTAELKARVDELSKLNKMMVGRELKMVEMKKKLAEFEEEKSTEQ